MKKLTIQKQDSTLFNRIYQIVREIPAGYVATYGQIAVIVGTKDSRKVGWALHGNKDPLTPCHRVVNREGGLAENFAFGGGWEEQKKRLLTENVGFKDNKHVDLDKFLWKKDV